MKNKIQKLICFFFGHRMVKLWEVDHDQFKYGSLKCYRCGYKDGYDFKY